MGSKSRETILGPSIRASVERAAAARKEADRLACEAWAFLFKPLMTTAWNKFSNT
jgi:hypothetical protein